MCADRETYMMQGTLIPVVNGVYWCECIAVVEKYLTDDHARMTHHIVKLV